MTERDIAMDAWMVRIESAITEVLTWMLEPGTVDLNKAVDRLNEAVKLHKLMYPERWETS